MKKLANLLLGLYCFWGTAQKPLDSIAYEQWERIVSPQIAYNGKWIAYQKVFQDETRTSEPSCFFVSTTGREMRKLDSTSSVSFVGTENWVLYNKNEKPVLYNPENQEKRQLKTSSYVADIPGTNWLYYSEYSPQNTEGTSTLVFYHIESGKSISYSHIQSYKILDGQHILFSQIENDKIALQYGKIAGGALSTVYTGYSKDFGGFGMTNNFEGTYITVEGNNHLLHYFNLKEQSSHIVLDFSKINLDDSHYLPVQRTYPISKNTRFILLDVNSSFGENNFQKQGKKTSDAEVWKWDEDTSERRQWKLRKKKPASNNPVFVYDLKEQTIKKILNGNEKGQIILPDRLQSTILQSFSAPYSVEVDWTFSEYRDLYAVSLETGQKTLVAKRTMQSPYWNPQGTYSALYNAQKERWEFLDAQKPDSGFQPMKALPYPISDQMEDMGNISSAYGIAGWMNNGSTVVLYDEFDLWAVDLTGKNKTYSLTGEYGRKNSTILRLYGAEYNDNLDALDFVLEGFQTETKAHGIYSLKGSKVTLLGYDQNKNIIIKAVAGNGDFLFTEENFNIFPNLWYADKNFKKIRQLTSLNPQQNNYNWGNVRLVSWKNFNNENNEGLLYLPENYDPQKTYPVIVHFYEKHSQDLHQYLIPHWSTSNIDIPTYVSKGYVVFQPDVKFHYNEPGKSAYNSVISGVQYLLENKISEPDKIGIQGHSFGGFETSYLITHSDIFKCAIVGSGVSDFPANYLSYRNNGISNMFKYEADQYRMKGSLFQYQDQYIENSPVFSVKNIKTPVLIFHNDKDRAVPFEQGMELFFALRRLQKPAWLINYSGEGHTLDEKKNQIDWTKRMEKFFAHYLLGAQSEDWMNEN